MIAKSMTYKHDEKDLTYNLLDRLFDADAATTVGFKLWDGSKWPDAAPKVATVVLNHPGALRAMFLGHSDLSMAEAYIYDDFNIEGDLGAVFDFVENVGQRTSRWRYKLDVARQLVRLPSDQEHPWLQTHGRDAERRAAKLSGKRHSIERDRDAVRFHYDVSNGFFALWLGAGMVYSCAYFSAPEDRLDDAQRNKLDYICRKLRLRPGQRFLDIGCGWGALVIHAARHYGVQATGITLSTNQADAANAFIKTNGLENRCRVQVQDYRELEAAPAYDAIASIGMFEHVGLELLPTYFRDVYNLLKPCGVFLNHGISSVSSEDGVPPSSFVNSYVFPDGELEPINTTLRAAEETGFEVRDVESLREHYALTLEHWVRNLETRHQDALTFVQEPTYRVWRLYMSGSAHNFSRGRLNVYQTLFSKPDIRGNSGLPLTRADWYRGQLPAAIEEDTTRKKGASNHAHH